VSFYQIRELFAYLCHRDRKLKISTATTKAISWEPDYLHSLSQNKLDRSRSRESDRQTVSTSFIIFDPFLGVQNCLVQSIYYSQLSSLLPEVTSKLHPCLVAFTNVILLSL